ncbi:MAG: hypothetical protein RIQ52_811 [Pseudomonadota bacterium]
MDVLIYLFENYLDADEEGCQDPDEVRLELLEAGFPQSEVNRAFDWLETLGEMRPVQYAGARSFRIFSLEEQQRLDIECRGYLLYLEQMGILVSETREIVIDRLMVLQDEVISLENLKWVVLMVLFSQPTEDVAFARMETLVYDSFAGYLH